MIFRGSRVGRRVRIRDFIFRIVYLTWRKRGEVIGVILVVGKEISENIFFIFYVS